MAKDIFSAATASVDKLIQTIAAFPAEKFNSVPFEGSWTAAQVADHILISVSGITDLLYTDAKPTSRRPDENVKTIGDMFLDFTTKMKSPGFVLPRNEPLDKKEMIKAWEDAKAKLLESISELDLSATLTAFELPGSGKFTRTEWVWFAIYHTQRHTHQLKNIHEIVTNKKQAVS
jgi:uncharacterized damage-inducible protein DinB